MTIVKIKQRGITADAVTTSEIAPATITAADIAPATITTTQIGPATIAQSNISPAVTLSVPAVTSDPPSPNEGDVWLRTDLKIFKSYLLGSAAWTAGTSIPYGATGWSANGTSTNSFFAVCGYGSHPRTGGDNGARGYDNLEFNGTSWSNETNFPYANSSCCSIGTQSARVSGGGHGNPSGPNAPLGPSYSATTISYEWDGTSWAAPATMNYYASSIAQRHGHGPISSAFLHGGWHAPGGSATAKSQIYDGTSWSTSPDGPTATQYLASAGPPTAILHFGGSYAPSGKGTVEWNGSSWSAEPAMSTSRPEGTKIGTAAGPTNTGVLAVGPSGGTSELYNGTSWAADQSYSPLPAFPGSLGGVSGGGNTGGGTSTGLLIGGGSPPYPGSRVAEYTGAALASLSSPAFS